MAIIAQYANPFLSVGPAMPDPHHARFSADDYFQRFFRSSDPARRETYDGWRNGILNVVNGWHRAETDARSDQYLSADGRGKRILAAREGALAGFEQWKQTAAAEARKDLARWEGPAAAGLVIKNDRGGLEIAEPPKLDAVELAWVRDKLEAKDKGERAAIYNAAVRSGNAVIVAAIEKNPFGAMVEEKNLSEANQYRLEQSPAAPLIQRARAEVELVDAVTERVDRFFSSGG